MKTHVRKLVVVATVGVASLLGLICQAQEVPKTPANTTYSLCGGSCNRSMEIVAMFDGIEAACQAAAKLRLTEEYVGIMTGKQVNPHLIHPTWRSELRPKSCSVARLVPRRCRPPEWIIDRPSTDLKSAEATVAKLRTEKGSAEVIYHLSDSE